jgi:hypothetical protein
MAILMTEGWRESSTPTSRAGAVKSAFTGTLKVQWGLPAPVAPLVHRAHPELRARQVLQGLAVRLDSRVPREPLDLLVQLDLRVRRDHKVPQVRQALKDRKVPPERPVRRVQSVPTERRELRERLASKDQPDLREQPARKDPPERKDPREQPVRLVPSVRPAQQVRRAPLVRLDRQVTKVCRVFKVPSDRQD